MKITYHGHSAFQIDDEDIRLVIDPYITANEDCDQEASDMTDVSSVLVTHGAFDHLGDAPEIAEENDCKLICDYATFSYLKKNGFPEKQLEPYIWGAKHYGEGWEAKIVEAHHQSVFIEEEISGQAMGYILDIGGEKIYHMGDTSIFGDIELFGELYEPSVLLVPIGEAEGYFAELHPDEAALATKWIDPDIAIPMHYPPESDRLESFLNHCEDENIDKTTDIVSMKAGEEVTL